MGHIQLTSGSRFANDRYIIQKPLHQLSDEGQRIRTTVYQAHDSELSQDVALKIGERNIKTYKQLQMEAIVSKKLYPHPASPIIYDHQTLEEYHFLSMQLIEGKTLEDIIYARSHIPLNRIIDITLTICCVLYNLHRIGLIHRDLKPGNILFGDHTYLLDFGIVASPKNTGGRTVGTPGYMSSEQARGSSLDYQSDICSLGIVLYEMLTGENPMWDSNTTSTICNHIFVSFPKLPINCLFERFFLPKNPQTEYIHEILELIIRRMTRRDRTNRYPTILEVIHELSRLKTFL